MKKRVGILGSSGFIGKNLSSFLKTKGYEVSPINRSFSIESLKNLDFVINLAGKSINCYWSKKNKKEILSSRVDTTKNLIDIINSISTNNPIFLINASAVGIYKSSKEYIHTESSEELDNNFLANVCLKWEEQANNIYDRNNLCIARFGVVLSKSGGAFEKMKFPLFFKVSPIIGDGEQFISWIGLNDLLEAIHFIIKNRINGIVNITSPKIITYSTLAKTIAKNSRAITFKIPQSIIKTFMGESSDIILNSHYVLPQRLQELSFNFKENNIDDIDNS